MSPQGFLSALLLAAGRSERFPPQKLLLELGRSSILVRSLANLSRSRVDEIVVVLGSNAEDMLNALGYLDVGRVKAVVNADLDGGMGASIAVGLRGADHRSDGYLIALGDMPLIRPSTIDQLLSGFKTGNHGIVVPVYRGRQGHPAIFHRRYRKELASICGDWGGRAIIEANRGDLLCIKVDDRGVVIDIDTCEDYALCLEIIDDR